MYAQHAYLDTEVVAADSVELVRMLYRGAFESVTGARRNLHEGDIAARSRKLSKAGAILSELALSLDHSANPDFSGRLAELYDYLQRLIMKGNFEQKDEPLAEAERLLSTMLAAWENCRPAAEEAPAPHEDSEYAAVSCTY